MKAKRRRFHALLHVTLMADVKESILESYGVTSTMDMSEDDLDVIIAWLEDLLVKKKQEAPKDIRELRHKCLRMMSECGIDTKDWNAVNRFMMNPRIAGKHLYEIESVSELQNLHRKLHNVRDRKNERAEKELYLSQNN